MKRIFAIVVILMSVFMSSSVWANNLLSDAGFENGLNNWNIGGPNWSAQSNVVYSGSISAKNTIGQLVGQDYFSAISQEVPLSSGTTIYSTAYVKTNIDVRSSAVAGVLIQFLNGSGNVIGSTYQDEVGGNTNWRNLYVSAVSPSGTAKVRVNLFVYATQAETTPPGGIALDGENYFDNIVLSTDPISPPPVQTTLINAGLENGLHDWNLIYSPAFVVEQGMASQGNYSVKNTILTTAGQDFFSSASQDLQYLGGKLYGTAQMKTTANPTSSAVAGLLFEYYNNFNPAPGSRIGYNEATLRGNNSNWTRVIINGVTPPTGTVMIRVHIFSYAAQNDSNAVGAIARFDDIVFTYSPIDPVDYRVDILNEGFENALQDWSDQYGFPAVVSSTAHSGLFSAKKTIDVLNPPRDYYSQLYQDIYFNSAGNLYPTNTNVYATAYLKTVMNPITKSVGGLQLEFINPQGEVIVDGDNNPIVVNDTIGGNTDWRYLYVEGKTPANTSRVRVSGIEFARKAEASLGGSAYYDDFNFSLVPLVTPPEQSSLLNSNFENGLNDWDENNKPGEVSSSVKFNGNYSAYFQIDEDVYLGLNYFGTASQEIGVVKDQTVEASVMVKTDLDPLFNPAAGIELVFLDSDGDQLGSSVSETIRGINDWTKLEVSKVAPVGSDKVRITLFLFSLPEDGIPGNRAYFDNVTLVKKNPYTGGGGCFLAGTRISLADGSEKNIEDIQVGDMVESFNETTGTVQADKVVHIFQHEKEDQYLIVNNDLKVTPIHRVLSNDQWVEIGSLQVGDMLTKADGQDVPIESIEKVNELVNIYNFEVNPTHTYVANGFIVHNRKLEYEQYHGNVEDR